VSRQDDVAEIHLKVLVVEDDASLRRLWEEVLSGAGHMVTTSADAASAREALLARPYDVVVLDLNLGDDRGLSVALLATYYNPECKVVMITGSSLFAKGEIFEIAPSVSTVLRKPVAIEELLAVSEHGAVA
jgi:DNA-binding NtrC family response regulator